MRARLNKRVVDALKPPQGGGRLRVQDTVLPGFGIVVYESGRRSFVLRYGPKRRQRQYVIGEYPALSVEEARAMAQTRLGDIIRGVDPLEEREAQRALPSVKDWIDGYDVETSKKKPKHIDGYLEEVRRRKKQPRHDERYLADVKDRWGSRPIDRVSRHDVEQARADVAKRGNTTANRWLASVRSCFQAATDQRLLAENPAEGIKQYRKNTPRARFLSDEEYARVVAEIDKVEDPSVRAAFVLLLDTGARKSEVLRARWADIDLEAGLWRIPSPKAGHPQVVPLAPDTVAHLESVPRIAEWVVPGRSRENHREDLKGPWEEIRAAAKIGDVTIHDIRRTFGVHVARTAGLHVASKLLRHSDVRVTERVYVPLGLDALREALTATHAERGKVLKLQRRKGKRA